MFNKDYFKDWNYKKHAKFCTTVYLGLYVLDMTVSYLVLKKCFAKLKEKDTGSDTDTVQFEGEQQ